MDGEGASLERHADAAPGAQDAPPGARVRWIRAEEAVEFACGVLLDLARVRPVVAVSTDPRTGRPSIEPEALAREIGEQADVVAIETGDATWALSEALPPRLDVYGGAVRIWWPGLSTTSDPYDHVLLFVRTPEEAAHTVRRIVAAVRDGDPRARRYGPWRPAPPRERLRPPPRRIDAWKRLGEVYRVGDVVRGCICKVDERKVLVEVLPGAALLAPIAELDWSYVKDPREMFRVGQRVNVKILDIDPEARRGRVSIKQAYATSEPLPPVSLGPDDPPFLADEEAEPSREAESPREDESRERQIAEELDSALADRTRLLAQVRDLKKRLRSAEDRLDALGARSPGDADPTSSEAAFLTAVRVEYARRFNESDRQRYPLQPMRVGRAFLDRLRRIEGIAVEKVIEVCAQVACLRAHEIPGRAVHELRDGEAGASPRTRRSDGAKAWRCSLQDGTPSARRLHWWDVPGPGGRTIEFASVNLHDDDSIPS